MLNIIYSERFVSQFESLSVRIQKSAHKKIEIFRANPKHASLNTHKLNGILEGYFSFSVDYKIRIVFEYGKNNTAHFLKIGNHDVYR